MAEVDHAARREAIRELLRTTRVGTQEELRDLLFERKFDVTQATLSRDLARLGARRVTLTDGGSVYELPEAQMAAPSEVEALAPQIVGIDHNDSLVVVLTPPGAAPAVGVVLDRARLPDVLGTIAGDDTIFIAPSRKSSAAALAKRLKQLWKKGGR